MPDASAAAPKPPSDGTVALVDVLSVLANVDWLCADDYDEAQSQVLSLRRGPLSDEERATIGLFSQLERLSAQRDAALALHQREDGDCRPTCSSCLDAHGGMQEWPCATARALEAHAQREPT